MKTNMKLHDAETMVSKLVAELAPYCTRIETAGSIRRRRAQVGDLEIVCIPKTEPILDLLGFEHGTRNCLIDYLDWNWPRSRFVSGKEYARKYRIDSVFLDLNMTTPAKWGIIYMIRTGSAAFSKLMVTTKQRGGLMPSNLRVQNGRVWNGGTALETPEEIDVFNHYGLNWIEPERREV